MSCHWFLAITLVFFVVAIRARLDDDDHEEKPDTIYLVVVRGEPLAATSWRPQDEQLQNASSSFLHKTAKISRAARQHDRILRRTARPGAFYRKLYGFHHAVNGFAVHTTATHAARLRAAREVAAVEEDSGTVLMTTYTPRMLGLPDGVWRRRRDGSGDGRFFENDGEGVVVGVVDTGVDPTHPSFAYVPRRRSRRKRRRRRKTCPVDVCSVGPRFPRGSCNGKIVAARYFAAGALAAALPLDASRDLSPFDVDGHGSHVASIAVGNRGVPVTMGGAMFGFASGMAPVYKAIYPAGGTMADLISAIDQATQDNVDVLVLSIGPDARPTSKVTFVSMLDIALLFAARAGVFVVQAAGNRGPAGSSVVSYSPWVTTVAAGTTGRSYTAHLVLGNGRRISGLGLSAPTPGADCHLQFRLVAAKDIAGVERADECQDATALRRRADVFRGSIVICSFSSGFYNGTSTLTAIVDTAKTLDFAGFVLVAGAQYGDFVAQPLPFSVPGVMVPRVADADAIWSYYAAHTSYAGDDATVFSATAEIAEGRMAAFTAAPAVARYSSRGPDVVDMASTPADVLKPDILAPGDQIWAAWSGANEPILAGERFAIMSGTSMAAPHAAGVAALVRQRHPSWPPSAVASALSTTASTHDARGIPIVSDNVAGAVRRRPATPFDYGAGFINPAGALDPGLVFAPVFDDYIGFLCSLPQLNADDVRATTGTACPSPELDSPADLNLPSITVSALRGSISVRRTVTNVANNTEIYLCAVLPPAGVAVDVRPEWFEIAPGEKQEMVVELEATWPASGEFSFGEIVLTGSLDHLARLPLSVRPVATSTNMNE
uniref:Subtilisin-like protease fibronectin type-III domain-containing protein n=1 Tax=Leersia perrieri TaxID=77586 RepID=A0A0D9W2C4_9ORYZ